MPTGRATWPAPYTGMSPPQLYRALGVSNRIHDFNDCFKSHGRPAVRITQRDLSQWEYERTIETPAGRQTAVFRKSPNNEWHMPVKWPITTPQEMRVAAWRKERRTWTWDQSRHEPICKEWAGLGAPTIFLPRVTVQDLYVNTMGGRLLRPHLQRADAHRLRPAVHRPLRAEPGAWHQRRDLIDGRHRAGAAGHAGCGRLQCPRIMTARSS
ncbi:MAG: hypothetical protein ACE15C_21375 [Phycisphaerae bacterium]